MDWRFLLGNPDRPRALVLGATREVRAGLELVADRGEPGRADLVVLGFPNRRDLRRARETLAPGGEIVCLWRRPRLAGTQRARRRLRAGGFGAVRFYWPGPDPLRDPDFWLPLGLPAARRHLFSQRPPRSRREALRRRLHGLLEWVGLLAPICAIAARGEGRPPQAALPASERIADRDASLLLLTEGAGAEDTVIGIPFGAARTGAVVIKSGRLEPADASLLAEDRIIRRLAEERPQLKGVPRPLGTATVAGRPATAQTALVGRPFNAGLDPHRLSELAPRVTHLLIKLAEGGGAPPTPEGRRRLIREPLDRFLSRFGASLDPEDIAFAERELDRIPTLPSAWEHRDCGVWNLAEADDGTILLYDWEFSEPRGLPGCDLAFFLATATFEADGVLAGGAPDPGPILASHRRLLDGTGRTAGISAACESEYCAALGIERDDFIRLRLLSWIAQAARAAAAPTPPDQPDALRPAVLARFIEAEIQSLRGTSR